MKKLLFLHILCTIILSACNQKINKNSNSNNTTDLKTNIESDSIKLLQNPTSNTDEVDFILDSAYINRIEDSLHQTYIQKINQYFDTLTALDTFDIKVQNNRTVYLLLYEYYDSIPERPIKSLRYVNEQGRTLFGFTGEKFHEEYYGPEEEEFLSITPYFYLTDTNNLTINLRFKIESHLYAYQYFLDVLTEVFNQEPDFFFKKTVYQNFSTFSVDADKPYLLSSKLNFSPQYKSKNDLDSLLNKFNQLIKNNFLPRDSSNMLFKEIFILELNGIIKTSYIFYCEYDKAKYRPDYHNIFRYYINLSQNLIPLE